MKRKIQEHPQWREYLDSRHILEPTIAAGAWVEHENHTGQDVLVWREKRRDGSAGATRRRLLQLVSNNGMQPPKVRWQSAGQKTDEPFHYLGSIHELKQAIADAGCQLNIVEGEFDVWSMNALGSPTQSASMASTTSRRTSLQSWTNLASLGSHILLTRMQQAKRAPPNLRTLLHQFRLDGCPRISQVHGTRHTA